MKQLSDILKEQSQHCFLYKDLLEDNCCYDPSKWSNNMSDSTEDRTLCNKSITILPEDDITAKLWCQE